MSKPKRDYWQKLIAGLKREFGDRVIISPLPDPPAPLTGLTGQELADLLSPQPAPKDSDHNDRTIPGL